MNTMEIKSILPNKSKVNKEVVKLYDRPVSLLNSQFEPALKSKTIERGETKSLRQKSIEQLIFEQ